MFDFYKYVFNDPAPYAGVMPPKAAFNTWRTYQMSDHLIVTEFGVDKTDAYLKTLAKAHSGETTKADKKTAKKKAGKPAAKTKKTPAVSRRKAGSPRRMTRGAGE